MITNIIVPLKNSGKKHTLKLGKTM